MRLTPARVRGLQVLAAQDPDSARESNTTDLARGLIYWQTVRWLIAEGLAYYPTGSTLVDFTAAGRDLWKSL